MRRYVQTVIQQTGAGEQNVTINVVAARPASAQPSGGGIDYATLAFYDLFEPQVGAMIRQAWKRQLAHDLGLEDEVETTSHPRGLSLKAAARELDIQRAEERRWQAHLAARQRQSDRDAEIFTGLVLLTIAGTLLVGLVVYVLDLLGVVPC